VPTTDAELLGRIERYYDLAPRVTATTEEVGPFTLFLRSDPRGWPYYARPRTGAGASPSADDVREVRRRQRELSVPEQLEWVGELVPGLAEAARDAGMTVQEHPLMVLSRWVGPPEVTGVEVRLLAGGDPSLGAVQSAISAGFEESDEVGSGDVPYLRDLVASGTTRLVGAFQAGVPVGGGSHQPRDGATELTGIAVVPRARRRGVGAAVTAALVADAHALGVRTVLLSAGSPRVADVYARVGFVRVATACIAEVAS
jgi:ribosomal protein S18 acetylase RimI-like enzyme